MDLFLWIAGPFFVALVATWIPLRAFVRHQQLKTR